MMAIMDKIWEMIPREREEELLEVDPCLPVIYGTFTNWEPKSMREIVDLVESYKPQFDQKTVINTMQTEKAIPYSLDDLNEFSEQQRQKYRQYMCRFFEQDTPNNWK
jgi:hypothetical protein